MGDFNHPDICWKSNTARQTESRRFLQSIDDNFLTQVVEEPTRRGVLLDLVLTNKERVVGDMKAGGLWAALAAVTMRCWSSGSCVEGAGQ